LFSVPDENGLPLVGILDDSHQPSEHVRGCWIVNLLVGQE